MNKYFQIILSAARQVLIFVGGVFVGKGVIDQSFVDAIVPAIVTILTCVFGLIAKTKDVAKVEAANVVLQQADAGVSKKEIATAAAQIQK